jgi:8-oxo-dGTP diphosphatase
MEARGDAAYELMRDVRAVDWLPLGDAVDRLSRGYERAFLENVGPIALAAAAHAAPRKARAKLPAPAKRRPSRTGVSAPAPADAPTLAPPQPEQSAPSLVQDEAVPDFEATAPGDAAAAASIVEEATTVEAEPAVSPSFAPEIEPVIDAATTPRKSLLQRMRDWLRRAT